MKRTFGPVVCALILGASMARAESGAQGAADLPSGPVIPAAASPRILPIVGPGGVAPPASEATASDADDSENATETKWSKSRPPMPFDVMRSVQFLQDQVARGNDRAIRVQALLLRRFGRSFLEADPAVWQDRRNLRAAVLYTLSGGPPDLLERLLREGVLDEARFPLIEGALAYVGNDFDMARTQLSQVDLTELEPVLAAQLSLVMGQIEQVDHPSDAVPHLDRARLLAPGTLVEEAALRLEAMLVDELGDHDHADRLARQYFDRFADSSYAANFEARFAAIYAARAMIDPREALVTMADVIAGLPNQRQQTLFLAVARRSLVSGNLVFANAAASRALAMPDLTEGDRQRGELYEVASALGTADARESRVQLGAIDRERLHPEDATLLDAAYSVLHSIDGSLAAELPAISAGTASADLPPILARAEQALADASQDLKQSRP